MDITVGRSSDTSARTLSSIQKHKATSGGERQTRHNPKGSLQTDLEALAEVFEAEDREDRRKEAQLRRDGLPEPKRDIKTFDGFANRGAAPRA